MTIQKTFYITAHNDAGSIANHHFVIDCPYCGVRSGVSLLSFPRYEYLFKYRPFKIGMTFLCDSCKEPVFAKFMVGDYDTSNSRVSIVTEPHFIETPIEKYNFEFVPETVAKDFQEALICYSNKTFNAFAAMCRRTIQSIILDQGVKGNDRIQKQVQEMKDISGIDDETFKSLNQIIIDGHDGAHPHLVAITQERAEILLALMKDVIQQLYVRIGQLKKTQDIRNKQISSKSRNVNNGG